MSVFKFNLRDSVRDSISGFAGTVLSRTEWTNGCLRYLVQPKCGKDGKLPDAGAFDEGDLVLVKAAVVKHEPKAGGPRRDSRSPVGH